MEVNFIEMPIVISVYRDFDKRANYSEIHNEELIFEWFGKDDSNEYAEKALIPEMAIVNTFDINIVHSSISGEFCNVDICGKNCIVALSYDDIKRKLGI